MLLQLNIKNFALIENLSISFQEGFNVFSGETGAGKSILIDAISYLLGGKFSKDLIRTGEELTFVEGVFTIENPNIKRALDNAEIEYEDMVIISRETFISGRSIAKINGKTLLLSTIKAIGSTLLDIHGQHQNQDLLNPAFHLVYLDFLGKDKIGDLFISFTENYNKLNELNHKINEINGSETDREKRLEFIKFQIEDIEGAKLKLGEDKELETSYHILINSEKISQALNSSYGSLYEGAEENSSIRDDLSLVMKNLHSIEKYFEKLKPTIDNLEKLYYDLEEIISDIRGFSEEVYYDEGEIEVINKRIYQIDLLKKKYGKTIEDILTYADSLKAEEEQFKNRNQIIATLNLERQQILEILEEQGEKLHDERTTLAEEMERKVKLELNYIGMGKSIFKINIEKGELTSAGYDKVQFMIATNPGEPLKSLEKIVSGGELSRIMLALKTVFVDKDEIPTVIFDEIDTGISGRIAQSVGEKMYLVSQNHQVFCVTHLPQISSMSDVHYLVNKETVNNKTYTTITKLNSEEKEKEIGKMLGGSVMTKLSLEHAKEIIQISLEIKNKLKK
ncbi:MAG TPA: DNA repair protein RecN [Clostridiaceae bacterium]